MVELARKLRGLLSLARRPKDPTLAEVQHMEQALRNELPLVRELLKTDGRSEEERRKLWPNIYKFLDEDKDDE